MNYGEHGIGDPLEVPITTAHLRAGISMLAMRQKVLAHEIGISESALKVTLSGKTLDRPIAGERTKSHRRMVEYLEKHGIVFTESGVMLASHLKPVDESTCFDYAVSIASNYINGNKADARSQFKTIPYNSLPLVTLLIRKVLVQLEHDEESLEKFLLSL
jgi:hypothetical protein